MSERSKGDGFDVPNDSHDTVPIEIREDESTFVWRSNTNESGSSIKDVHIDMRGRNRFASSSVAAYVASKNMESLLNERDDGVDKFFVVLKMALVVDGCRRAIIWEKPLWDECTFGGFWNKTLSRRPRMKTRTLPYGLVNTNSNWWLSPSPCLGTVFLTNLFLLIHHQHLVVPRFRHVANIRIAIPYFNIEG